MFPFYWVNWSIMKTRCGSEMEKSILAWLEKQKCIVPWRRFRGGSPQRPCGSAVPGHLGVLPWVDSPFVESRFRLKPARGPWTRSAHADPLLGEHVRCFVQNILNQRRPQISSTHSFGSYVSLKCFWFWPPVNVRNCVFSG